MNHPAAFFRRFAASAGAVLLAAAALCCGCDKAPAPAPPKPPPALVKTNSAPGEAVDMTQFVSVFEDLPPDKGRDPFFPSSHRRDPVGALAPVVKLPVEATLVLKGVAGSVGRRLAVINNEIMAAGEESPVRVPNGHVKVKCLEIGEDYVVVQVEGEPQPKRLTMEKK